MCISSRCCPIYISSRRGLLVLSIGKETKDDTFISEKIEDFGIMFQTKGMASNQIFTC